MGFVRLGASLSFGISNLCQDS